MPWLQNYDPCGNPVLSTLRAAVPVVVLLGLIALGHVKIHLAAGLGLLAALGVAILGSKMPWQAALGSAGLGAADGLLKAGWIVLNLIFLYEITVRAGLFEALRHHLARLAPDARVQVIVIAFGFGAFFEGAAGFGTPVAVTAAILIQLGFRPLMASGLSLIANTAPVAFGALGTPIIALSEVTGLDVHALSAMVGHQLPIFSLIVPFWVVAAFAGIKKTFEVWPAALVAGLGFALPQYLISTLHGPWLVDIVASASSIACVALLLRYWQPKQLMTQPRSSEAPVSEETACPPKVSLGRSLLPWAILVTVVFFWGMPQIKQAFDALSSPNWPIPGLHLLVQRAEPVAPPNATPEKAVFALKWLSATGTGILIAAVIAGFALKFTPKRLALCWWDSLKKTKGSLTTIAAMIALGYVTKYSGADATLGLALAKTGPWYPFFGTLIGWLGVALTGSDTASNVLFGGLQKITAQRLNLDPLLMAAANSSGGVMGKMIDAQSLVVASTATQTYGQEGKILRWVFGHSLVLAALVGLWVWMQAALRWPVIQ